MNPAAALSRHELNRARSQDAFLARKLAVDALLARLAAAADNHFGADPDGILWCEAGSLGRVEELLEEAVRFIGA